MLFAQTLLTLTGPDHQIVEVNPAGIVSMRVPRKAVDHFAPGTHCVIFTSDGKYTLVQEECDAVAKKMR